jgi:molybdopterin-guanine dinucleotide biosynthesis protein A
VAIYGTSCEVIKDLVRHWSTNSNGSVQLGFVDAEHGESPSLNLSGHYHVQQNGVAFTDATHHAAVRRFQLLSAMDLVIVNGNHFEATSQIVIVNLNKESSLKKRKDQLKNVIAIVSEEKELPEFILDIIPQANELPRFLESDRDGVLHFLLERIKASCSMQGLVLVGGESKRMGKDKSMISDYFDKPMFNVMGDLLQSMDLNVFFSCPSEKRESYPANLQIIEDRLLGMGPLSGIVSAFLTNRECAWLVVACDLPLLDQATLRELISKRNPSKIATAFVHEDSGLPEPLITIWEPKAFSAIMSAIAMGITCPRKILLQSDIEKIIIGDSSKLMNANTPEDLALAQSKIR